MRFFDRVSRACARRPGRRDPQRGSGRTGPQASEPRAIGAPAHDGRHRVRHPRSLLGYDLSAGGPDRRLRQLLRLVRPASGLRRRVWLLRALAEGPRAGNAPPARLRAPARCVLARVGSRDYTAEPVGAWGVQVRFRSRSEYGRYVKPLLGAPRRVSCSTGVAGRKVWNSSAQRTARVRTCDPSTSHGLCRLAPCPTRILRLSPRAIGPIRRIAGCPVLRASPRPRLRSFSTSSATSHP